MIKTNQVKPNQEKKKLDKLAIISIVCVIISIIASIPYFLDPSENPWTKLGVSMIFGIIAFYANMNSKLKPKIMNSWFYYALLFMLMFSFFFMYALKQSLLDIFIFWFKQLFKPLFN